MENLKRESQTVHSLQRVFRDCSPTLAPKSRLTEIVEALLGRQLTHAEVFEGDGFDLESLIGLPCEIIVTHHISQAGTQYDKIEAVAHRAGAKLNGLPF